MLGYCRAETCGTVQSDEAWMRSVFPFSRDPSGLFTMWLGSALLGSVLAACGGEKVGAGTDSDARGAVPDGAAPAPRLKRLTDSQYRQIMADVFGEDVQLPANLEADERVEGLYAVGAATTAISSYGVEKYEGAAYDIAEQVLDSAPLRDRWVPCASDAVDELCITDTLDALGLRLWRRPLSSDELAVVTELALTAGDTLGSADAGLTYGMAALLMSPHFLYRVELGDGPDAPEDGYDDWEMASRLSFFLWNTTPDGALLDDAASGRLTDPDSLAEVVDQMLADDRTRAGVSALFTEMLHLDALDSLTKDPSVFIWMSDELGPSARTETLSVIERHIFDDDASWPDIFTTRETLVDRTLAALYDVPAPTVEGFGPITLPADGARRGLLGQASFLVLQAHAASTSVTRRGMFVREVLLCTPIPEPPANANTAIPEVAEDARTMRERIAVHLEDPACAACHQITDPIGLAFENFDGIGRFREAENGAVIDPSGALDGDAFADAREAGAVVARHHQLAPCLTETLLQYATGASVEALDDRLLDWHTAGFVAADHRVLWLLRDVALSPAFRGHSPVE